MPITKKTLLPLAYDIKKRLQTLMLLRVVVASFLLGATIFLQIKATKTYFGYIQSAHFLLIAGIYFLTIIYLILYKYVHNYIALAYGQVIIDTFLATCIIYVTGGIESIFSFLYILIIITSSILLSRKGGLIIATFSSLFYTLLLMFHYHGLIHPLGAHLAAYEGYKGESVSFTALANVLAFYLICFLTSYLAETANQSKIELMAKELDVDQLELLNDSIIKSIGSALFAVDENSKVILLNPAAEALFKIRSPDVLGRRITDILPFLNGQSLHLTSGLRDITTVNHNGDEIHLRYSISPLKVPIGKENGFIFIFQDITKLKEIEQEMKKVEGLAMVGELAAGIAHEIRNPMASISGSIQMLKEELGQNEMHSRLMDIVLREISRLNNLVNDFLLFARPKQTNLKEFDLNQLILEALELFKNSEHWSNKVRVDIDLEGPLRIISDPEQIKQVLWNLFVNSCEAMPEGGMLFIDTKKLSGEKGHDLAMIRIRDTGKGFDDDSLKKLFVPFFTTKDKGSGLGLAIVKRIVNGLGGNVEGSNHPKGGAQLTVTLPIRPVT